MVGPTGCGKTTLTALVPRLYDVTEGRILIDGVDVRELPLAELRSRVACAFEDPTLFSASVRENLVLGRPDADEEQVDEALRVAQAGFVRDLPWGLDTRVGEQGMSLSGGQRQRVALARAVLGRPSMLVLDDPLSALDIHTESLVEHALRSVLAETTGLVVAHRPSTVLLADRVACSARPRTAAPPSLPRAPTTNCSRPRPSTGICSRRARIWPTSPRRQCDDHHRRDHSGPYRGREGRERRGAAGSPSTTGGAWPPRRTTTSPRRAGSSCGPAPGGCSAR
jgi:ABC-type nitrate/sulfonate/bicarbonate transport system ATPase subunit